MSRLAPHSQARSPLRELTTGSSMSNSHKSLTYCAKDYTLFLSSKAQTRTDSTKDKITSFSPVLPHRQQSTGGKHSNMRDDRKSSTTAPWANAFLLDITSYTMPIVCSSVKPSSLPCTVCGTDSHQ